MSTEGTIRLWAQGSDLDRPCRRGSPAAASSGSSGWPGAAEPGDPNHVEAAGRAMEHSLWEARASRLVRLVPARLRAALLGLSHSPMLFDTST